MATAKKPITVRIDPALLEQVRLGAARDNRTVTNFIETALRRQLGVSSHAGGGAVASRSRRTETRTK